VFWNLQKSTCSTSPPRASAVSSSPLGPIFPGNGGGPVPGRHRRRRGVRPPCWRPLGAARWGPPVPALRRLRVRPYADKHQEATAMEDIAAHREAPRRPIPQGRWLLAMSWLKLLVPHASRIPRWPNPTPMARPPTPTTPSPPLVPSWPAIAAVAHPRHPRSERRRRRPSRRENRGPLVDSASNPSLR